MLKSIAGTLGVRLMLVAATFASSIITARLLGPEGRGVFFYWSSIAALAVQFCALGLPSSNTYYLARDHTLLGPMAANAFWLALLGAAGFAVAVALAEVFNPGAIPVTLGFGAALVLGGGLYYLILSNLLVARQRFLEFNVFELANRYGGLAVIAVALLLLPTPGSALLATGVATVVVCVGVYLLIRRTTPIPLRADLSLFRKGFRFAAKAYAITLLGFLALRLNVFILNEGVDAATLGQFSIATQILEIVNIIPATVALVLFPALLRSTLPFALMVRQLAIAAAVLAVVFLLLFAIGEPLVVFVYGEGFRAAFGLLLWGALGAFALGLLSIVSQYLAAVGMPFLLVVIWLVGVAFELALALALIPTQGAQGAMLAFSAAHLAIFAMASALAWYLRTHRTDGTAAR